MRSTVACHAAVVLGPAETREAHAYPSCSRVSAAPPKGVVIVLSSPPRCTAGDRKGEHLSVVGRECSFPVYSIDCWAGCITPRRRKKRMPRLNYGTLLENIVVVESTRLGLEHTGTEDALCFATSFAMPPMTQCWCKVSEEAGNPRFNHAFLLRLGTQTSRPASLQAMWSVCMKNLARLPIRPFHQTEGRIVFDSGGPNGALLVSMLAVQSSRKICQLDRRVGMRPARSAGPSPTSITSRSKGAPNVWGSR